MRPRQEDHQFEASLSYIGRPCLNKTKQKAVTTKNLSMARLWWLTPAILVTQEAEIRRIKV
jgi:hypothetical protein